MTITLNSEESAVYRKVQEGVTNGYGATKSNAFNGKEIDIAEKLGVIGILFKDVMNRNEVEFFINPYFYEEVVLSD